MWFFFFFKQQTAYEIPKRDWSSDVCSSDLSLYRETYHIRPPVHPSRQGQIPGRRRYEGDRSDQAEVQAEYPAGPGVDRRQDRAAEGFDEGDSRGPRRKADEAELQAGSGGRGFLVKFPVAHSLVCVGS